MFGDARVSEQLQQIRQDDVDFEPYRYPGRPSGRRLCGVRSPSTLALMHALVRFAHIAAGSTFTTAEIHPAVIEALGWTIGLLPNCPQY
jgi:hypothetical protein